MFYNKRAKKKYLKDNNLTQEDLDQYVEEELFDIKSNTEQFIKLYKAESVKPSGIIQYLKQKKIDEVSLNNSTALEDKNNDSSELSR